MNLSKIKRKDINKLSPNLRELFKKLTPLLKKINFIKINKDKSKIKINTKDIIKMKPFNRSRPDLGTTTKEFHSILEFEILMIPKYTKVAPLKIYGTTKNCILILANQRIEKDYDKKSIEEIISEVKDYLDGILIVKAYGKRLNLLKIVYFYGFNGKFMRRKNAHYSKANIGIRFFCTRKGVHWSFYWKKLSMIPKIINLALL